MVGPLGAVVVAQLVPPRRVGIPVRGVRARVRHAIRLAGRSVGPGTGLMPSGRNPERTDRLPHTCRPAKQPWFERHATGSTPRALVPPERLRS